ncbi:hypothetical protein [Falsibacillus pallidus]|uniref:hypothetical protein n=1 Tax=Falsibacillus pallidus TaxID=493781 RepID=UPI003D98AA2C
MKIDKKGLLFWGCVFVLIGLYYIPGLESIRQGTTYMLPIILVIISQMFRSARGWILRYIELGGVLFLLAAIDIFLIVSFPQGDMAPGETYDFASVLIRVFILFFQNIVTLILLAGTFLAKKTMEMKKA